MKKQFNLLVKTGDQEGAGTDANVYVALEDEQGTVSPKFKLDRRFRNDLERNHVDNFQIKCPDNFTEIRRIRISRDTKYLADDWFCDYIFVEDLRFGPRKISLGGQPTCGERDHDDHQHGAPTTYRPPKYLYQFPIHRWIAEHHEYIFHEFGIYLPHLDPQPELRKKELESKRSYYNYIVHADGLATQIENLPSDEKFSEKYYWTFVKDKAELIAKAFKAKYISKGRWQCLDDLGDVFEKVGKTFGVPNSLPHWNKDDWFAYQRLQGVNPVVIKLCPDIPDKLGVTEAIVGNLLEGFSLAEAVEKKKIFICDLKVLEGLVCKDNRELSAPIALFYLNKNNKLLPIAIQLKQQKGPANPVYTPMDAHYTWILAKMFYNNAEAQHHQAFTHLGFTHLLMEGVAICTHRNLSPSHPLFKLMAPHFLFLLAINTRGLEKLLSPGGWVDTCMTQGNIGIFNLMRRGFDEWDFNTVGRIDADLECRGVSDPEVLPYYPYRDDALAISQAIKKYVATIVSHHYDTPAKLNADYELKKWREELGAPRGQNGVGLRGIPGHDINGFTTVDEVIEIVAFIISTCSQGHAASNFQQYHQYAFVPNYPAILLKPIPTSKPAADYTEKDIMQYLPDKAMTLDIMVITKLLSSRGTKKLGDFEMQYLYDPVGVAAADELRKDLKIISLEIQRKNVNRDLPFDWLDPEFVPNSISI